VTRLVSRASWTATGWIKEG